MVKETREKASECKYFSHDSILKQYQTCYLPSGSNDD